MTGFEGLSIMDDAPEPYSDVFMGAPKNSMGFALDRWLKLRLRYHS